MTAPTAPAVAEIPDELLTPAEVAALFRVTSKTVSRWSKAGLLPAIRTLGGHRRFPRRVVEEALAHGLQERDRA